MLNKSGFIFVWIDEEEVTMILYVSKLETSVVSLSSIHDKEFSGLETKKTEIISSEQGLCKFN